MGKMKEIQMTERESIINDLLLSGYSEAEVASLTGHLDHAAGDAINAQWMFREDKLGMAHSLSLSWMVRRLRKLADSAEQSVAMAALEQLVKISLRNQV